MTTKRYAVVGTGDRATGMYINPLAKDFPGKSELAAIYDSNPIRMAAVTAQLSLKVPSFTDFNAMMKKVNPDGVIVASRDCTHAEYLIAALKAGKRAISEKPLCTTAKQCQDILAAARKSAGKCFVTHNVRYDAASQLIRSMIRDGTLGDVFFMQFDETLDRCHGADYFRRWHRFKANSGGLQIHKASHHFDILNWWAGSNPEWVSAQGRLRFYGANGPFHSTRCRGCPHAQECALYADLFKWDDYKRMYLNAESADGYFRDGCVFDPSIDIEDQMSVLIRYANGIHVNYTLLAYSPFESQRIVIEGSKGRLEYFVRHNTGWVVGSRPMPGLAQIVAQELKLFIQDKGMEIVPIQRKEGGHGGADPGLQDEFFGRDWDAKPTERMASLEEAIQAILIGTAVTKSIASGKPVDVQKQLASA